MFRVGQKVVCVDDTDTDQFILPSLRQYAPPGLDGLNKGVIYTIRGFNFSEACLVPSVLLEEIIRSHDFIDGSDLGETGFAACRFRPLVESKTSISVFTEMLRKADQKVKA